jgi:hypothetical protein
MAVAAAIVVLIMVMFLLLYASGKTKWSLDQMVQYMSATILILGVVGGSLAIFLNRSDTMDNTVANELAGIELGLKQEDVRFLKGEALESLKDDGSATWVYDKDYRLAVFFDNEQQVFMVVAEGTSGTAKLPGLPGINWNMSVEDLTTSLGEPTQVEVLDRGLARRYEYHELKLFVGFTQGAIDSLGIRDYSATN